MLLNNKSLSIKTLLFKQLDEGNEPFFYLAPEVVGSINNAYPSKGKKLFIIDFNRTDNKNMKLAVPKSNYDNYCASNANPETNKVRGFLMQFLKGARPHTEQDGALDEIVDEFGDIYSDKHDTPANIRSSPGQGQRKDSGAKGQFAAQYTRMISPLGYGGVVW